MALNKFMHPRNIYKTPPDFEKMTKTFSEFSDIAKMDAKGKVTIDFKDPHSIRILTKCLLKSDFKLDVEIPEDRLVPTLPLRLNYILWIEDLITAIGSETNVKGIDIGTGACAIYPLLAAVKNKWYMLGTEMDAVSLQQAQNNVLRNNLQELVQIKSNEGPGLIENLLKEDDSQVFDFCMCNPPFYSNLQELCDSRSPARLPPKNGFTGSVHELITEGGELEFTRKIIQESKNCKNNIVIFTTMIGHKYNLSELLQDLKADNIKHTHTEFCQGRVTRWGLAWTYQDHDIYKLVPPREKPRKKNVPVIHRLPKLPNCENNVKNAFIKLKMMLGNLNINYRVLSKQVSLVALNIVAKSNTWSNQRRKKRQLKQIEQITVKKIRIDEADVVNNSRKERDSPQEAMELITITESQVKQETMHVKSGGSHEFTEECSPSSEEVEPLVQALLKIFDKENTVHLETVFFSGTGGKESLHQIIQYIKNNWKYYDLFLPGEGKKRVRIFLRFKIYFLFLFF